MLYRFIRGKPCGHLDLVSPPIWRGVARRLAQWHAALPSSGAAPIKEATLDEQDADITVIQPRRAGPSIWAVLQKWVLALPVTTPEQRARRLSLQAELQWVVEALDDGKGIGEDGVCFVLACLGSVFRRGMTCGMHVANRPLHSSFSRTVISSAQT